MFAHHKVVFLFAAGRTENIKQSVCQSTASDLSLKGENEPIQFQCLYLNNAERVDYYVMMARITWTLYSVICFDKCIIGSERKAKNYSIGSH